MLMTVNRGDGDRSLATTVVVERCDHIHSRPTEKAYADNMLTGPCTHSPPSKKYLKQPIRRTSRLASEQICNISNTGRPSRKGCTDLPLRRGSIKP